MPRSGSRPSRSWEVQAVTPARSGSSTPDSDTADDGGSDAAERSDRLNGSKPPLVSSDTASAARSDAALLAQIAALVAQVSEERRCREAAEKRLIYLSEGEQRERSSGAPPSTGANAAVQPHSPVASNRMATALATPLCHCCHDFQRKVGSETGHHSRAPQYTLYPGPSRVLRCAVVSNLLSPQGIRSLR